MNHVHRDIVNRDIVNKKSNNDEECKLDKSCVSGYCESGFCKQKSNNDEECKLHISCKSGVCNSGICVDGIDCVYKYSPCSLDSSSENEFCYKYLTDYKPALGNGECLIDPEYDFIVECNESECNTDNI